MSVGLSSLYLTELPQKQIRGAIGSFHQLAATFGILLAQMIGMKEILGKCRNWLGIPFLLCLLFAIFHESKEKYLQIVHELKIHLLFKIQVLKRVGHIY